MAKIIRIEVDMVRLQPKVTRQDAIQSFVCQETPIVRITDSDGYIGIGYTYTIGSGGLAITSLLEHTLAPSILGLDANRTEYIWHKMLFTTHATAVGAITSLALATIDLALWDLKCKRQQLPLWIAVGGMKDKTPLYTTERGWLHLDEDELVAGALEAQSNGFIGTKIKLGRGLSEDYQRLRKVRQALGDDFLILTDANQSFTYSQSIAYVEKLKDLDIYWLEEPMPADDVGAHKQLNQKSMVPIAVGESMYSLSQFKDYLQSDACSIVQADVARVGGITPWLKIANLANAHQVMICPHFLMEIHISLVCAVDKAPLLEYIPQLDELTRSGMTIENGYAIAPSEPGLGIDWDFKKIDELKVFDTIIIE